MSKSRTNFIYGVLTGAVVMLVFGYLVMPNLSSSDTIKAEENTVNQPKEQEKNTASNKPVVAYEDTGEYHTRGNPDAPITIVEFSDFQCPYCSRFSGTMEEVVVNYPNDVKWVYRHFPLDSIHPYARKAAEASECAGDQDKFWEYHDELFDNQSKIKTSFLEEVAEDIGLDVDKFNECLTFDKYASKVEADYQEGISLGVRGTPGGFINGQAIGGAVPYSTLQGMIDDLLE